MKNIYIIGFLIPTLSWLYYALYIHDSHIHPKIKLAHYLLRLVSLYTGAGSKDFNRERANVVRDLLQKYPHTNKEFKDGILVDEVVIKSSARKGTVERSFKMKIFVSEEKAESIQKLPVLFNIHGGGFVLGSAISDDARLAEEGFVVVSIFYSLAPEHKFPAGLEDCYTAMVWLNETENDVIRQFADLDRIGLIGFSAGGNFAATLPFLLRERNYPRKVSHQILFYPSIPQIERTESYTQHRNGYILSDKVMDWFIDNYLLDVTYLDNPLVNPMKNSDFSNLPKALFVLSTEDVLYSEGKAYADLLKANNAHVEVEEYYTVHGFNFVKGIPETIAADQAVLDYFKKHNFLK